MYKKATNSTFSHEENMMQGDISYGEFVETSLLLVQIDGWLYIWIVCEVVMGKTVSLD